LLWRKYFLWNLPPNSEQSQLHLIAEEQRILLTTNKAMNQAIVGAVLNAIGALGLVKNLVEKNHISESATACL